MAWRVAKSLATFIDQVNKASPRRNKGSDGTIGDASHASRMSDHNPWVRDGGTGIVTAIDITHDPRNGVDTYKIAEALRKSRDGRIKYVISDGNIFNQFTSPWAWRSYGGSNPHSHHIHISVLSDKKFYDAVSSWKIGEISSLPGVPQAPDKPVLLLGSKGPDVKYLQKLLSIIDDGIFGPITQTSVRQFQRDNGLVVDGVVGRYTWEKLL